MHQLNRFIQKGNENHSKKIIERLAEIKIKQEIAHKLYIQ